MYTVHVGIIVSRIGCDPSEERDSGGTSHYCVHAPNGLASSHVDGGPTNNNADRAELRSSAAEAQACVDGAARSTALSVRISRDLGWTDRD